MVSDALVVVRNKGAVRAHSSLHVEEVLLGEVAEHGLVESIGVTLIGGSSAPSGHEFCLGFFGALAALHLLFVGFTGTAPSALEESEGALGFEVGDVGVGGGLHFFYIFNYKMRSSSCLNN